MIIQSNQTEFSLLSGMKNLLIISLLHQDD